MSASDFSLSRVFDTAAMIPRPIMTITPMTIQIGGAPNLFAVQANPPVTKTIPIKYIAKFDIYIFLLIKYIIMNSGIQSGEGMKKELHPLGKKAKGDYSLINEIVSIEVL